jgi:hypothetical protein
MAPSRPFQPTRAAFAAVLLALFALLVSFSPVSAQKEDVSPSLALIAYTACRTAWKVDLAY